MKNVLLLAASALLSLPLSAATADSFVSIPPCRILDTRVSGGPLVPGVNRSFMAVGNDLSAQGGSAQGCGIPQNATAAWLNVVAVGPAGPGHLFAWQFGEPRPAASALNYSASSATGGLNIGNATVVKFESNLVDPDILFRSAVSQTHLVADVLGYYLACPRPLITVLTSEGKICGTPNGLAGDAPAVSISVEVGSQTFIVNTAFNGGTIKYYGNSVFFKTADCTGTTYVPQSVSMIITGPPLGTKAVLYRSEVLEGTLAISNSAEEEIDVASIMYEGNCETHDFTDWAYPVDVQVVLPTLVGVE